MYGRTYRYRRRTPRRPQRPQQRPNEPQKLQRTQLYKGRDVHAYTSDMQAMLPEWLPKIRAVAAAVPAERADFKETSNQIQQRLGASTREALHNMARHYRGGRIYDADLPGLNGAELLIAVWDLVLRAEPDILQHFQETLVDIGGTCIQGITHRLFSDFVALYQTEPTQ